MKQHTCSYCNRKFYGERKNQRMNVYCSPKCSQLHQRRTTRPNTDALLELAENKPYLLIGRTYGVCDNTVRKWIRNEGLQPPTKKEGSAMVRCAYCKARIRRDMFDIRRSNHFFCNKEHHDEWKRNRSPLGNVERQEVVELVAKYGLRATARMFNVCHQSLKERFKI